MQNGRPKDNDNKQPTNNQIVSLPTKEEIEEKLQKDKQKEEILNSPTLKKEEDKNQAEKDLRAVVEAELLIKRKKFSSLVLKKLKELLERPLICKLLNQDKRVENAISKLEMLEKQQKNQEQKSNTASVKLSDKVALYVSLGIIGVVLVGLALVLAKKNKNKSPLNRLRSKR